MPDRTPPSKQARSNSSRQKSNVPAISNKDEIIVALGRAGSGKSTFVQVATKVEQEISKDNSLKAKTTSVKVVRVKSANNNEQGVDRKVIIDTPGVENDILEDQPMFVEIAVKTKSRPPVRITGIVYFVRIEHHTPPTTISAAFDSINQFRGQFPNRFDKMVVFALWKAGNHADEDKAYSDIQKAVDGERKKRKTMTLITSKGWDMTEESAMAILNEFKNTERRKKGGKNEVISIQKAFGVVQELTEREAAGKTSPEKREQLTIPFSGSAQEALDILRSLIPRLNV